MPLARTGERDRLDDLKRAHARLQRALKGASKQPRRIQPIADAKGRRELLDSIDGFVEELFRVPGAGDELVRRAGLVESLTGPGTPYDHARKAMATVVAELRAKAAADQLRPRNAAEQPSSAGQRAVPDVAILQPLDKLEKAIVRLSWPEDREPGDGEPIVEDVLPFRVGEVVGVRESLRVLKNELELRGLDVLAPIDAWAVECRAIEREADAVAAEGAWVMYFASEHARKTETGVHLERAELQRLALEKGMGNQSEWHGKVLEYLESIAKSLKAIATSAAAEKEPASAPQPQAISDAASVRNHLAATDIAKVYGIPRDALDARLRRFRKKHAAGNAWYEAKETKQRAPTYLYDLKEIAPIIDEMKRKYDHSGANQSSVEKKIRTKNAANTRPR